MSRIVFSNLPRRSLNIISTYLDPMSVPEHYHNFFDEKGWVLSIKNHVAMTGCQADIEVSPVGSDADIHVRLSGLFDATIFVNIERFNDGIIFEGRLSDTITMRKSATIKGIFDRLIDYVSQPGCLTQA